MASSSPDPIQRLAIKRFGMEAPDHQVVAHFEALDNTAGNSLIVPQLPLPI